MNSFTIYLKFQVGASFLQLNKVRDACANFLISKFHPHNVLGIRNFADSLGCSQLVQSADKYIHNYFSKISTSDEFLALRFDELLDIIRRDEINVVSEEKIFEAAIKWVKHNPEERGDLLPEVLSKVRLPLLSPQYLAGESFKLLIISSILIAISFQILLPLKNSSELVINVAIYWMRQRIII